MHLSGKSQELHMLLIYLSASKWKHAGLTIDLFTNMFYFVKQEF